MMLAENELPLFERPAAATVWNRLLDLNSLLSKKSLPYSSLTSWGNLFHNFAKWLSMILESVMVVLKNPGSIHKTFTPNGDMLILENKDKCI